MGPYSSILLFLFVLRLPHGDLQQRIADLTDRISTHPDSLSLYESRGELYLQHGDFQLAYADFNFCLHHGFTSSIVLLGMSQAIEPIGSLDSSMYYVTKALEIDPEWISAMEWKARLYFLMKNPCASAATYESLLEKLDQPGPSLFIDAADAWKNCNEHDAFEHSVEIVRSGLSKIGPLHVLERKLVELYIEHKDYDEALAIESSLIDHAPHAISLLVERAAIYQVKKDIESARNDLYLALTELDALPAYKSGTPAMTLLRSNINYQLNHLED